MSSAEGRRPVKRRKATQAVDEDLPTPQSQAEAPSATALSTRVVPLSHVPSLSTCCIRVFASRLGALSSSHAGWETTRLWLKALPDALITKVFAALRTTCPTLLDHAFIVTYFMRGETFGLSADMPGVKTITIAAIDQTSMGANLQELELRGFSKQPDTVFASVISSLPSIRVLNLSGCTKVGLNSMQEASKNCPHLTVLNLKYTAVPPIALAPLLRTCKSLEVLKVVGISSWTDAAVAKLWDALGSNVKELSLNLKTLNVRQCALTDNALAALFMICPNLTRVDLSFTLIHNPKFLVGRTALEKLSLTSTAVTSALLLEIVSTLSALKVLNIGALGGGQGSSVAISNSSAMTMTDQNLHGLTDILQNLTGLERINLVGNTKLGIAGRGASALADFIRRAGRRCKVLNLASIPALRSAHLEGLAPDVGEDPSPLHTLNLNNTRVDDDVTPYIASCSSLRTLSLAGTKVTNAGLYPIIDACPYLEELDLTSCRGVGVVDRRRFFEVWEREWKDR